MTTDVQMAGQVALVTGASRGIGRAIALELAKQGMQVVGTATTDAGSAAITEALAAYPGCKGVTLDVNDGAGIDAAVDAILKEHGGLHVVVNNAGITRDMLSMRMKDDDWDAVIDTNLKAVFRVSRAVTRPMMKQRYGRIVNITSVVGASGNAGQANYAAAKAGVAGMVARARARQPRHHGQLHRTGFHRDRHDQGLVAGPVDRADSADPDRPPRPRERHRSRGGVFGVAERRLHHGQRAACQRRHVHELRKSRGGGGNATP